MRIPISQITFHPASFGDPNGRVFLWHGDMYRTVERPHLQTCRDLFARGIVQQLVADRLLVETEPAELALEGYEMVLKHRIIPHASYAHEWCGAMLKDAALKLLALARELARHGLTLQDAHPWNLLFDGTEPCFIDFGSIVPATEGEWWCALPQFMDFYVHPLLLISRRQSRIAHALLHDHERGVTAAEMAAVCRPPLWSTRRATQAARSFLRKAARHVPAPLQRPLRRQWERLRARAAPPPHYTRQRVAFFERLALQVEAIRLPQTRTTWDGYYDDCFPGFAPSPAWTPKHHSVFRALAETRPNSVLDLGSNRGWFSQLAARQGAQVVAADTDEGAISSLYRDARANHLSILPVLLDVCNPTPGVGVCNRMFAPSTERFRCEMTFALALVHHLAFSQNLRLAQIVQALSAFTEHRLLVEFILPDDRYVRMMRPEGAEWYTLAGFEQALGREFRHLRRFPSNTEQRILILCER